MNCAAIARRTRPCMQYSTSTSAENSVATTDWCCALFTNLTIAVADSAPVPASVPCSNPLPSLPSGGSSWRSNKTGGSPFCCSRLDRGTHSSAIVARLGATKTSPRSPPLLNQASMCSCVHGPWICPRSSLKNHSCTSSPSFPTSSVGVPHSQCDTASEGGTSARKAIMRANGAKM